MARVQHGLPGIYNSSPFTLLTGDGSALSVDVNGNLVISGAGTGGTTAPTTSIIAGGVYNTSAPTYTNGQQTQNQADANGNLKDTLATLLAGENLTTNRLNNEPIYSYQNITTNATTTLKSGAGTFHGFTVNNNGFTTAGTITIYDNTAGSGTTLGTWTVPLSPPGTVLLATPYFPPQLGLDATFATGLTIVTATTAPAANITALFR